MYTHDPHLLFFFKFNFEKGVRNKSRYIHAKKPFSVINNVVISKVSKTCYIFPQFKYCIVCFKWKYDIYIKRLRCISSSLLQTYYYFRLVIWHPTIKNPTYLWRSQIQVIIYLMLIYIIGDAKNKRTTLFSVSVKQPATAVSRGKSHSFFLEACLILGC